ncbi:MAG: response regulator transcription factor [Bryobacteraceae bacterium]
MLLVEDEEALSLFLRDSLKKAGYSVEQAFDGNSALAKARSLPIDLIILDVMLPQRDGFDVCRTLRSEGSKTPILMLTARSQTKDTVEGLKIGADDYVTKPFEMSELMARVEALLRRFPPTGAYSFGPFRVDFRGTEVTRDGKLVNLSAREFQLLRFLIEHRGETVSREMLLKEVWGYDPSLYTRTVDMRIATLRQHLEDDPKQPRYILTVQGLGYKFRSDDHETTL